MICGAFWESWGCFFNSNFLLALVGSVAIAWYVYKQKSDKRDAARLILQEIRYAEQQIRNFKVLGKYHLADKLLSTNHWNDNINKFTNNLSEADRDLISRFYANASYLDTVISKISDEKNSIKLIKEVPGIPLPIKPPMAAAPEQQKGAKPPQPIMQFSSPKIVLKEIESMSNKILKDVSNKIEFIYSTSAVDKLREEAERKIFLFL